MRELPVRKKIRLQGYDYSQTGYYYVTICVKDRNEMFGKVVGAASCRPPDAAFVQLTNLGEIVANEIIKLSSTYNHVTVDKYVIMPNHVHMIIAVRSDGRQNAAPTVGQMMNQWKRAISIKAGFSLWQRSYHDHIIRNEAEYRKIWQYIEENPAKWAEDCYYTV